MLILNIRINTFIYLFLGNKSYKNDKSDEFENISSMAPDEFICCGFVNFEKNLYSNEFLKFKII